MNFQSCSCRAAGSLLAGRLVNARFSRKGQAPRTPRTYLAACGRTGGTGSFGARCRHVFNLGRTIGRDRAGLLALNLRWARPSYRIDNCASGARRRHV